jgi:hypothetical protein
MLSLKHGGGGVAPISLGDRAGFLELGIGAVSGGVIVWVRAPLALERRGTYANLGWAPLGSRGRAGLASTNAILDRGLFIWVNTPARAGVAGGQRGLAPYGSRAIMNDGVGWPSVIWVTSQRGLELVAAT